MAGWINRFRGISRELLVFSTAYFVMGIAFSMMDSTFNNFLNERFALTGFQRSFLELPRELPGFLVVFVSALLSFLCSRRLGFVALLMGSIGALLIGFISSSYAIMILWLFLYSMGNHLLIPIASTIGMELAREGRAGQRLGQLNAVRNLAMVLGSFLVVLGFRYLGFSFQNVFLLVSVGLAVSALLFYQLKPEPQKAVQAKTFLTLHRSYRLYYILSIISGARKQLFLTFAPWVLVQVFRQPTQIMATLFTIGGVIGILFQPMLGKAVDRLGERVVLATEAVLLVGVCFGYGFARIWFEEQTAFLVVCACFLLDQMLFSVGMARSTYMKKTATDPAHIQPALTAAVTIDHVFSISAALIGGVIWNVFGYQYVFLLGVVIALISLFFALQVRIPETKIQPVSSES
jgi:predicted MFS family arabinose efflux permease